MIFSALCVVCSKELRYTSGEGWKKALARGVRCRSCGQAGRAGIPSGDPSSSVPPNPAGHVSQWERPCPKCQTTLTYLNPRSFLRAVTKKSTCTACSCKRGARVPAVSLTRHCPGCNILLTYASKSGWTYANAHGQLCRSCRHKKRVRKPRESKIQPGQIFGDLTVLSRCSDKGSPRFICKCVCGITSIILGCNLTGAIRKGYNPSCGCGRRLKDNMASFNKIFKTYQRAAKSMTRVFELTPEKFKELISSPCVYCGALPTIKARDRKGRGILANGIARIDSNRGYTPDNCCPCCTPCNIAKKDRTVADFKAWIQKAYVYQHGQKTQKLII